MGDEVATPSDGSRSNPEYRQSKLANRLVLSLSDKTSTALRLYETLTEQKKDRNLTISGKKKNIS